jgi:hypothetical protein
MPDRTDLDNFWEAFPHSFSRLGGTQGDRNRHPELVSG